MGKRRKKARETEEELVEDDDLEEEVDKDDEAGRAKADDEDEGSSDDDGDGESNGDRPSGKKRVHSPSAADDAEEDDDGEESDGDEEEVGPDDPYSVEQLKKAGCRVDVNDKGNVWRVFLYEKHTNSVLNHTLGLPGLKELWLLGSKVTKTAVSELQKELPKTKMYL